MSVRACRLRAGYSQLAVMQALGCSSQTVQRWDDGVRPYKSNVVRLCRLFGVDAEQLLGEEPTPEPDMEALLRIVDYMGEEAFCAATRLTKFAVALWREGAKAQPGTLRQIGEALDVPVAELMKQEG